MFVYQVLNMCVCLYLCVYCVRILCIHLCIVGMNVLRVRNWHMCAFIRACAHRVCESDCVSIFMHARKICASECALKVK